MVVPLLFYPQFAHLLCVQLYFGWGEFDGQGSGHDFSGTLYVPPSGSINSCDGGRSHTYCDYRQQ